MSFEHPSEMKMAFWATVNALMRAYGQGELDFGTMCQWWNRFESELEMERAFRADQKAGRTWD